MRSQRAGADRRKETPGNAVPIASRTLRADGNPDGPPGNPRIGKSNTGPRHDACVGARRKKRPENSAQKAVPRERKGNEYPAAMASLPSCWGLRDKDQGWSLPSLPRSSSSREKGRSYA